jgi:hypothetical protein
MNKKILLIPLILAIIAVGYFGLNYYFHTQAKAKKRQDIVNFTNSSFSIEKYNNQADFRIAILNELLQFQAEYTNVNMKFDLASTISQLELSIKSTLTQASSPNETNIEQIISISQNELLQLQDFKQKAPTIQCIYDALNQSKEFEGSIMYLARHPEVKSTGIAQFEEAPSLQRRLTKNFGLYQKCNTNNQKSYEELSDFAENIVQMYLDMPVYPTEYIPTGSQGMSIVKDSQYDNLREIEMQANDALNKYYGSFGFNIGHQYYESQLEQLVTANRSKTNALYQELIKRYDIQKDYSTGLNK